MISTFQKQRYKFHIAGGPLDEISELPAETPFPPLAPEKGVTDRWQDWALLTPPSFSIPWRGTGAGDSHGWCLGKLGAAADLLVPSQQSPPARQAPVRGSSSELALDTDPTQPSPRPGQEGSKLESARGLASSLPTLTQGLIPPSSLLHPPR